MSPVALWALLIALSFIANMPFVLYLITHWKNTMAISPAAQTVIDSLTTANTQLTAALTAAGAQGAEDVAAISAAAQPLVEAISAATPAAGQ